MFPSQRGGHLEITNLRERIWKPTLRRAGVRERTLYQTRTRSQQSPSQAGKTSDGWRGSWDGSAVAGLIARAGL